MKARWLLALPLATTLVHAQARPAGPDSLTRRAMALAYLRIELAVRDRPLAADRMAETNQTFDRATLAFFGGRYQQVIGTLDSLGAVIEADPAVGPRHRDEALRALDRPSGERRVLSSPDGEVPYRLYRPQSIGNRPAPVVVALHGAGADETAFLEAYGAGWIRRLADSLGFIVVSPFTNAMMRTSTNLPRLLDDVAAHGPIDRARVYLLGHSLGGGVAWRLAQDQASLVAAVVCLAGAGAVSATAGATLPRTLVVGASVDPVVPPARLKIAVDQAHAIGWPVDYRELPNQGHTLMVGAFLDQAVAWLLTPKP